MENTDEDAYWNAYALAAAAALVLWPFYYLGDTLVQVYRYRVPTHWRVRLKRITRLF